MKYIRFFENKFNSKSLKDIANKYHDALSFIKPAVIKKYHEICNDQDQDFGQDIVDVYGGDCYFVIHNIDQIQIQEMKMHDNKIFFTLEYFDYYGDDKSSVFYVPFTEQELDDAIIELDSKKYNL